MTVMYLPFPLQFPAAIWSAWSAQQGTGHGQTAGGAGADISTRVQLEQSHQL